MYFLSLKFYSRRGLYAYFAFESRHGGAAGGKGAFADIPKKATSWRTEKREREHGSETGGGFWIKPTHLPSSWTPFPMMVVRLCSIVSHFFIVESQNHNIVCRETWGSASQQTSIGRLLFGCLVVLVVRFSLYIRWLYRAGLPPVGNFHLSCELCFCFPCVGAPSVRKSKESCWLPWLQLHQCTTEGK